MDEPVEVGILFCKHTALSHLSGDFISHICSAIDKNYLNQAHGAHK